MLGAVKFETGIESAWTKVATFVPKFVAFLVVLVIGWFIAKAVAKAIAKVLERVGFDKAVERGGVGRALERSKYDASDVLGKIAYYVVLLFVLQLAFGMFGPNPVSELLRGVVAYLPKVFAAVIIIVVASAIAAAAKEIIEAALGGLEYGRTLAIATSIGITAIGVFMALSQLQIAPAIVNGLFYALLAVIVGSAIIAIGGGGIQPMRERWENALARWDEERPRIQEQREGARERIEQRAEMRKEQLQSEGNGRTAGAVSAKQR